MASSAIKSVQQMGELLGKEAKSLYNIQDKIKSLQTELEWMECFLEDTNGRQHKNKLMGKWVAQITEFQHLAEDLVEGYLCHATLRQDSGIWNDIKWFSNLLRSCHFYKVRSLGSKVDDLISKIAELNSRLTRYGVKRTSPTENVVFYAMMREERPTYSDIEGGVVGLEKDVQEVVRMLTETEVRVVGIAGVEGLGKSALARKVFVDNAIKRHFRNNCVWVYVTKDQTSIRNVFEKIISGLISKKAMAEYTGKNDVKDLEDGELVDKIHELLKKKGCFVILDDIFREGDWDALKPALGPIESSRTKILLTTNNQGLLKHVDSNAYVHRLHPLQPENSWELLQGKAFPRRKRGVDTREKPKMMELGRKMVKHCHGLPLAIVALGGILSTKRTYPEWEEVENNISPYLMTDKWAKNKILAYLMTDMWGDSETGEILSVLELSYDALPFYLRACFLYLASFPQDYEISIKRLYSLWEAEGLLQIPNRDDTSVVTCFDMGDRYLMELIQRSMVQVGKCSKSERIKSCRIHDLMRDLCIKKCKEESFLNVQKGVITERQFRRHALHLKGEGLDVACLPQHGKQVRCIRSLLAFQLKASELSKFGKKKWLNMVKRFPIVRVLDLQDAKIDIKVLKVGHLVHLRYLNLRDARVEKVASCIGDLTFLVTLDLRVEGKIELPNKFHRMKRLKHLYLPREFSVKYKEKLSFGALPIETLKNFCPGQCVMKDIKGMESLRVFRTNDRFEIIRDVDELKVFEELPLLSSVRLQVAMGLIDKDPRILRSVFKGNRCFVELELRSEEEYPELVNAMARGDPVFPRNLRRLTIKHCTLPGEGIVELGMLDNLEVLILVCVHVGNKITFSAKSFPCLNTLTLWNCDLAEWEVGDGALPKLRRLKLRECRNLKNLPRGLPDSVDIDCYNPWIKGIEDYNTCPHFKPSEASSDASACT